MVYPPNEYYRLDSRINDLVKFLDAKSVDDVYEMYKKNITPDMRAILINISTNNETYFFRDGKPFMLLSKIIMPEILSKYPNESIKIWSAASSTGQEAFSILMSLSEALDQPSFSKINVSGSDISTDALKKAMLATYNGLDVQRGLPISLLMKYFSQIAPETWKINADLVSKVQFQEFNLLTGIYPRNAYHVIFCRNVLIYQNIENKKVILENIYESLKPGGVLFLGAGESLIGIQSRLERVAYDQGTVYRKN